MKPSEAPSRRNGRDAPGRLPLLLEHRLDLRAGQVHVHQRVGERLDVGGLAVGQRRGIAAGAVPSMSARRPPGFMNAISAPTRPPGSVAQRWTSATRLPSVDSPPRFSVVPLASLRPVERPADLAERLGPEHRRPASTASSTIAWSAGSAG